MIAQLFLFVELAVATYDDEDDIKEADDVEDGVVKEAEMLRESASTPFTTTILFFII